MSPMSLARSLKFVLYIVGVLALLMALIVAAMDITWWLWFRPSPTYRFSMPPGTALTEQVAIEYSRKALMKWIPLIADRGMCPFLYRFQGPGDDGRDLYFAVNTIDPNEGCVNGQHATVITASVCIREGTKSSARPHPDGSRRCSVIPKSTFPPAVIHNDGLLAAPSLASKTSNDRKIPRST